MDCNLNSQCHHSGNIVARNSSKECKTSGDSDNDESVWSIDDDSLFYPLGLVNLGTGTGKSVFAVWGENYLLNFIFKRSRETRRINLTKVRLAVPLDVNGVQEQIRNILILELNTLLLMDSGRIYYFSSVKSMHAVLWLDGVRCMSAAPGGFSVIRLLAPEQTLCLEVYSDVAHLGQCASTLREHYDITFDDRNLFNCQWLDERFILLTVSVDSENIEFVKALLQQECYLSDGCAIHFFTVSGSIFALTKSENSLDTGTTDFHIQLLQTYASNVELIQLVAAPCRMFVVFLQCGVVAMWRWCPMTKALTKTSHLTGTQYVHYEFSATVDATNFYYTNNERVTQLRFQYDAGTQACYIQETHKPLAGILACTWVPSIQRLICLSCNNIFYQLAFDVSKDNLKPMTDTTLQPCSEFEPHDDLYELTPGKVARLLEQARVFDELTELPAQLYEKIETEYRKQQLIAVANKAHIFQTLLSARLEFSPTQPSVDYRQNSTESVFLYAASTARLQCNALFALIHVRIEQNDIFETANWQLHLTYAGTAQLLVIPNSLLNRQLTVVLPLMRSTQQLLPHFMLKLVSFVSNEMEFRAITLPFEITVNAATYVKLFSGVQTSQTFSAEYGIDDLITQFAKSSTTEPSAAPPKSQSMPWNYTHTLCLPKSCDFSAIRDLFDTRSRVAVTVDDDHLNVYFMSSSALLISYKSERHCVRLQCADAAALYYGKMYLLHSLTERSSRSDATLNLSTIACEMLLQYQCDIQRVYDGLMQKDDDNMGSTVLRLESLKGIYAKLRNEA